MAKRVVRSNGKKNGTVPHVQFAPLIIDGSRVKLRSRVAGQIVQLPKDKIAVISGLKEYIVVDTEDVLMICPRSEEQSIKKFIDEVKFHNGEKHI